MVRHPETFPLFASEQVAKEAGLSPARQGLAYFEGSVSGLGPGSPVTFQGLRVGQVTSVGLEYDPASDTIRAPGHFQVSPNASATWAVEKPGPVQNAQVLVERGMRAQLQSSNLLTGQMRSRLDVPDAAPAEMRVEGEVLVLPTVPGQSPASWLLSSQLLSKLGNMPFDRMGESLDDPP